MNASSSNTTPGTVIVFEDLKLNIGDYYNPVHGTFRCGVSGIHMFTWSILVNAGHTLTTSLNGNGLPMGLVYVDNPYKNTGSGSNTVVVHISVGDNVFLSNQDTVLSLEWRLHFRDIYLN
ncbi:Complement C1q-like protein 2 [Mizuhopecten yessoensis]|uniref:Complement C1q-like protein 2 n=1 Tax=Mizuhopecten yessoensis TaxID=6573 RepID=A0A210R5R6_MIZYE|nr:Complement C1q-like protein 2 [Mizuhopecten yessoensis]OWF56389.1 Complement C1q-like protein 2 [Mizuhopecten yessoensis]